MHYAVMFVADHDLPPGKDWVLARQGDTTMLFAKESKVSERMLERAWCGANLLANQRLEREHGVTSAL
jgi:hypothetical protein